jgi:hypothetical protein
MRLFTRTVLMSGTPAEVMAFSSEMAAHVSKTTGVQVGLWNVQFGAPAGTMVYAARVEGLAQLGGMTEALMADSDERSRILHRASRGCAWCADAR